MEKECAGYESTSGKLYCSAPMIARAAQKVDLIAQYTSGALHERMAYEDFRLKKITPVQEKSFFFVVGERVVAPAIGGIGKSYSWISSTIKSLF
jgi:hypothetical protein